MGSNPINLAFRFVLEIAALFALGYWGWTQHDGFWRFVWSIGLVVLAAVVYVVCCSASEILDFVLEVFYEFAVSVCIGDIVAVSVVVLGNFDIYDMSNEEKQNVLRAFDEILERLRRNYGLHKDDWIGHGDVKATRCPGSGLSRLLDHWKMGV